MPLAQLEATDRRRRSPAQRPGPLHHPARGRHVHLRRCLPRTACAAARYGFEPNPAFAAAAGEARHRRADRAGTVPTWRSWTSGSRSSTSCRRTATRNRTCRGSCAPPQHGVGLDYVRDMAGLGYRLGTVDALIRLRDHGVDPGYVRGMAANGFSGLSSRRPRARARSRRRSELRERDARSRVQPEGSGASHHGAGSRRRSRVRRAEWRRSASRTSRSTS